ncbi:MAG TPA: polysaccharide biosynthesis tyrosine autokinase [Candidatus Anammoximicrobium sp.]|nr:polysaccharide biosynthesis tyrosine autokinase [Candidatus Anammoximicrobium sp.]
MTNDVHSATAARQVEFSGPPEQQESGWAFLGFIWRRLWLILLAVVVALGLGYLNFLKQPAVFQSSAQMLVVKLRPSVPIPAAPGERTDKGYDTTQETLLRSPVIVGKAVEKHGLGSLPSLRGSGSAVGQIIAGLEVTGTTSTTGDIIRFSYSSNLREDCPKVLDAIIDAYRDFLGETYENVNQETIDLITQAKDVLDRQIGETQKEYQTFREAAPLLYLGGEGKNVHEARLQQIEGIRAELEAQNWRTQAKIDAIEGALKRGGSREALNLMIGHLREADGTDQPGVAGTRMSVEEQMFPLLLEEQMLLEEYGADHPKVQAVRKRIEFTRQHLLGSHPAAGDATATQQKDFYQIYLDSLREQLRLNEEQLASMTRLFDRQSTEAKAIDKYKVRDSDYLASVQRKERMFDAVVARLEEINISKELGSVKTQVIQPPGLGNQTAPDLKKSLTTAAILGLLAGLGLAFVADSLDRRFRSPDDIRNDLGLPVVGHIPVIPVSREQRQAREQQDDADGSLDPVLRVFHHPRGRIAEAYRAVRTALYFSTRGSGHKVLQVTSPNPGDGKTTLASNLAVSIATSGKRTLLVDADFRRPRVHKLFGIQDVAGLSEVMAGSVELADAVQETAIENLSVLVCGRRPANPAELLTSNKFQELIEVLREKYDLVIFDTPPVLAVTDPLAVAPRMDGVLLVIRLAKSARNVTRKAIESLDSLGATVLGVVVNGIGGGSRYGGYGYSSYGYRYGGYGYRYRYGGYGYNYRYGHGYGRYGDGYDDYGYGDGDKSYYTEDDGRTKKSSEQRAASIEPKS